VTSSHFECWSGASVLSPPLESNSGLVARVGDASIIFGRGCNSVAAGGIMCVGPDERVVRAGATGDEDFAVGQNCLAGAEHVKWGFWVWNLPSS
jgi:hypothetical protein